MQKFKAYKTDLAAELKTDVLSVVSSESPITVAEIAKKIDVAWITAKRYLDILEKEGVVVAKNAGHIRIYSLSPGSGKGDGING